MITVKLNILKLKWILIVLLVYASNLAIAQVIKITGTPLSSVTLIYGTPSTSLTATTKFTVEGTSLTNDIVVTPPPEFEASRDNITYTNALTIPVGTGGNISPTEIYIRLKSTTNVGSYTDDIILSSGSTFVNVAMPNSTVTPASLSISIFAEINYGDVLNDMTLTSPGFDFSKINLGLKNGEIATSLHVSLIGGHTGKENVGFYNKVIVSSDLRGTFLPRNYTIDYTPGPITIFPAPLAITANNINKPYGNTLTGGDIASTAFTVAGLQNGETINSVTITYGNGGLANAPVGRYNDVVVPSGAVGGNGFLLTNYNITYQTAITVTPVPLTITADNKSKLFGDPNPPLTVTYTGFVNGEDAAQLTTQPIAVTTATQASDIGVYPITVSGGSSSNYTLNYVDGTLTIYKDISIPNTFTPNGDGINDTWSISNLNP